MSGGGGGGYPPPRQGTNCNIVERVPLNSAQPAVVPKLKVGYVLDVVLQQGTLLAKHQGAIAGSLTPESLLDLIECIADGNVYGASVVRIQGALCEVEIRRK